MKWSKSNNKRIDPEMRNIIDALNTSDYKPLACCCGHGKYPITIIVKCNLGIFELVSGKSIPRKKRFYVRDKQGYYYIPEVHENGKRKK